MAKKKFTVMLDESVIEHLKQQKKHDEYTMKLRKRIEYDDTFDWNDFFTELTKFVELYEITRGANQAKAAFDDKVEDLRRYWMRKRIRAQTVDVKKRQLLYRLLDLRNKVTEQDFDYYLASGFVRVHGASNRNVKKKSSN